jgi:hypothetical protein
VNEEYPPIQFSPPQIAERRKERPHSVPVSQEEIARRAEVVRRLKDQIEPLSQRLRVMSEDERRAVLFKLEHELPVPLVGTGLKAISEPSANVTLAIPTASDLDRLSARLDQYEQTAPTEKRFIPNATLATRLQTIAEASPTDRLSSELLERYNELIRQDWVMCEIEMLSVARGKRQRRDELSGIRNELMNVFRARTRGEIFEHEEIKGTTRAVIRCTGEVFRELVEGREWQRRITWFEGRPTFESFQTTNLRFNIEQLGRFISPPGDASAVCVIDSGVTQGNAFLQPVVDEELLRSFLRRAPNNPYDQIGHGSGVASLVAYYALNVAEGGENQARVWVASARILNEHNQIEDERLFSVILRDVVRHFAPLGIKIFNLSVNDFNLSWNQNAKRTTPRRSWTARAIDQISHEYDVIFVVSTGNLVIVEVNDFLKNEKTYPAYFMDEDASVRDPGQAALALTVGSIAPTTLLVGPDGRTRALAEIGHPSPFTRTGPGIRGEIKPELVDYGGNFALQEEMRRVRTNPGLDVVMATHELTPALTRGSGTSFAAARVSHKLARILSDLRIAGVDPSAALLRAFAVNSARQPISSDELVAFAEELSEPAHSRHLFGYGMSDSQRATDCGPYTVVLFHQGHIEPDSILFFDVPIPANLANTNRGKKRLTVTVVYTPEVQRWGLEEYLSTGLKWRMFRGNVARDQIVAAMSSETDENIDEGAAGDEAPDELPFELGINGRSRGTVQHDVYEWTLHRVGYSEHAYTLAVTAYERWKRATPPPVPLAILVRFEETTESVEVYAEMNASVETQTRAIR